MFLPRKYFKYRISFLELNAKTLQTLLQEVLLTNFVNGSSLMHLIFIFQAL